jgi:hypothetical protein
LTPGCCSTWMEQQMTLTLLTLMLLGERRSEVRELLLERKMEKVFGILACEVRSSPLQLLSYLTAN